ncbi:MAG TPA: DNA starvation/stationary phase protection protein [Acidobacteriaceae bacterium]|nr:DNA starvation/stationary phase protection protein [Acidobacteriaceae bacterium]
MTPRQTKQSLAKGMPASLNTPTDLSAAAAAAISETLRQLLADVFALYLKTKSFHWHISGPHFRDYHFLLDEQATEIFAMTDPIAERARKIGGTTLCSIGDIARHQRLLDNNEEATAPADMLEELVADSRCLTKFLRAAHDVCDEFKDVVTASLLEVWIDEAERRTWFLHETLQGRK